MHPRQAISIVVPSTQTSAVSKPHNLFHTFFKVLKTNHITLHHRPLHWLVIDARIKYNFFSLLSFLLCHVYLSGLLEIYTPSRSFGIRTENSFSCVV